MGHGRRDIHIHGGCSDISDFVSEGVWMGLLPREIIKNLNRLSCLIKFLTLGDWRLGAILTLFFTWANVQNWNISLSTLSFIPNLFLNFYRFGLLILESWVLHGTHIGSGRLSHGNCLFLFGIVLVVTFTIVAAVVFLLVTLIGIVSALPVTAHNGVDAVNRPVVRFQLI